MMFCINCGVEFKDSENFNWSCQVHRSDFGGLMWWCCGKTDPKAPGCRKSKHVVETKVNMEEGDDKEKVPVNLKCVCCGKIGHLSDECPRDPNIRGLKYSADDETSRIEELAAYRFRKMHKDSMNETTMKMIQLLATEKDVKHKGKDMMSFDDFQYNQFNSQVFDQYKEGAVFKSDGESDQSGSPKVLFGEKLFENNEILDMEEAQDTNLFKDISDHISQVKNERLKPQREKQRIM